MRERVLGRYAWGGATGADSARLDAVLTAALHVRERLLHDEEDPRLLHPARTTLILMDDAGVHDPAVLGAALLLDSRDPDLVAAAADAAASELAGAVPTPARAGELLLEELLAAGQEARLVACAERLDHARHAHMMAGEELWAWVAEAHTVYVPVAARTHPLIARRYRHWAEARERRAPPR